MTDNFKRALLYAAYFAAFYLGVKYALPLIFPFLIGLAVAAVIQKPAEQLSGRIPGLSLKTCCLIMTFAVIFGTAAVLYFAVCSAVNGAVSFCPGIPDRLSRMREFISQASADSQSGGTWARFTAFIASGANWCMDFFTENYRDYLPSLLRRSTGVISGLPSLLTSAVFAVMSAIFGCSDYRRVVSDIKKLLPDDAARRASLVIKTSVSTLAALLKAYGLIMLITFAELTVGLGVMNLAGYGTGNIVTIALVISLIDILPVLGTGTVLIPWGIFEILSSRTVSGIMLLALVAVVETVRNMIEPKLISGKLELHPFFALAGVYTGGKLFGASGILIMPLAIIVFRQLRGQKNSAAE